MLEREIPKGGYRWPSALRQDTALRIYANPQEKLAPHIKYDLSQGIENIGFPPFMPEVKRAMFEGDKFEEAIGGYGNVNLEEAEEFQYKWNGVTRKDVHASFGNRGSYGSLMDFFQTVLKAPNQGKVRLLDTNGVDFPAVRKAAKRYETDSHSRPNMPFYSLANELTATEDEILDNAIDSVTTYGKKRMKGFVVLRTTPSSPKGALPTDNKKTEELAYRCAKYEYVFGLDTVFMPIVKPENSLAYLIQEFPRSTILFSSESKMHGLAGLRQGITLMSQELAPIYEGTRTEYEFDGLSALFASEYYKFKYEQQLRDFSQQVVDSTIEVKTPLVEGLRQRGITVYDTDMRVPIFFAKGNHENFCRNLDKLGIKVAPGNKGFTDTYSTPAGSRDYYKGVLTGHYARVTTKLQLSDIDEVLDLFEQANNFVI